MMEALAADSLDIRAMSEVEKTDGCKEYFHIVTRKSNGKYNSALSSSLPGVRRGKKRGRKPKIKDVIEDDGGTSKTVRSRSGTVIPHLMVNERVRRKQSERFNEFLEVLKGEKDFYIDNAKEDIVVSGRRGRGRKKKQLNQDDVPTHHIFADGHFSVMTQSIDDMSDGTCVIHVKEKENTEKETSLQASVEREIPLNLSSIIPVQEILNLPSSQATNVIDTEQFEEKSGEPAETVVDFKELGIDIEGSVGDSLFEIHDASEVKTFQVNESGGDAIQVPDNSLLIASSQDTPSNELEDDFHDTKSISVDGPASKYRCKLCSNVYATFEEARNHAKTYHSTTVYEATNNVNVDSGFRCQECRRYFPTEKGRNKHYLLMHLKQQPAKCPDCSLNFNSFRPLERHLKEIHDRNPVNFCEICEEEFVLGTSLEHHISISHPSKSKFNMLNFYSKQGITNKRIVQCPLCNEKSVGFKAFRLHHWKIHNGEPFSCKQCKFKTNSASVLKRHLATIHKALDLSLYICVQCKVGYQLPQDLEEHYISAHNKKAVNLCPFCGEKFACLEMLRFHKGKHRAFTCDFCPLGFMKPDTLEEHLNTIHKHDLSKEAETLFDVDPTVADCTDFKEERDTIANPSVEAAASTKVLEIKDDGSVEVKENLLSEHMSESTEPSMQHPVKKVHHLLNTKHGNLQEMDTNNPLKGFRVKDLPKKVNCPTCGKLLTTKFLKTHMRSHEGSLPHKCPKCSKAYAQGTLLRKHMKNKHYNDFLKLGNKFPKKKKVRCEYCELIFDDIYLLEDHLWSHTDVKSYECEMCRIKFGMKVNWMEHYKTHYFKEEKHCPNCDRGFKSVGYYREHIERCQSNWLCEECGFKCQNPEFYRKHKKIEHSGGAVFYQCPHCGKSFYNKYGYDDHLITHSSDKQFTCNHCNKDFKRKRPLIEHISKVHIKAKHICSYCSLSFDTPFELRIHTKEHRSQQMSCGECGAVYLSRQTLDNHIAVYHDILSQEPFICVLCSEMFKRQIELKEHLSKHSVDPLFVCQVNKCHKMFRKDVLLRAHMARRHSYLEYYCHFCDKKFLLDADLQKHIETHREHMMFKCNACQFSCSSKMQLNNHKAKNHEERPFECSVCGIQALKKDVLVNHITTVHSCQKPLEYVLLRKWKCSICEKLFPLQNIFIKHLEQHAVHGVSAKEHHIVKIPLIQQPAIEPQNTISLKWEDLLSILRVEFVAQDQGNEINTTSVQGNVDSTVQENNAPSMHRHGDEIVRETNDTAIHEPLATSENWQCLGCLFLANTEEDMKNHIIASSSCLQRIEEFLTSKINNVPIETNEDPLAFLQAENIGNLQYILIDNSLPSDAALDSKDSVLLMDNNLQFVLSGSELSDLLNSSAADSSDLPVLEIGSDKLNIADGKVYDSQTLPLDLDFLSSDAGVLIQTDDGRIVIPEIGQGVAPGMAQYQLVKEETDGHGTTESTYEILDSNFAENQMDGISNEQAFDIS